MNAEKIFESESIIRFPDCDPFNHLNNGRYIDYFLNAREDHLMRYQNFNIYETALKKGITWVSTKNQIAYIKPALLMETVVIQSTLLKWREKDVLVEMLMWSKDKTVLKALLWASFVHFDLKSQKSIAHSDELTAQFRQFENPVTADMTFDNRLSEILRNLKTAGNQQNPDR